MSFKEGVALGTKSDKFFGLDKDDLSLKPQKAGWLLKKPYKDGFSLSFGAWPKKWFVVKDSFLFWYDAETKDDVGFDTKPKGCLPLGGAAVSLLKDKVTFELAHPIFASGELLMVRAGDTFDANEWITQIKAAMTATWENAILGFALIEKMKSKGTALEDEKEAVLQEAKANAERLQREKEESERLAALKFQTVNELEAEKLKMETEVEDLKKKSAGLEGAQAMERAAYEEEKKRRQAIESALQAASKALSDLEQAFTVREKDAHGTVFKDNAQVKSNVANLKVFFEAHAAQHEKRRAFFKRG